MKRAIPALAALFLILSLLTAGCGFSSDDGTTYRSASRRVRQTAGTDAEQREAPDHGAKAAESEAIREEEDAETFTDEADGLMSPARFVELMQEQGYTPMELSPGDYVPTAADYGLNGGEMKSLNCCTADNGLAIYAVYRSVEAAASDYDSLFAALRARYDNEPVSGYAVLEEETEYAKALGSDYGEAGIISQKVITRTKNSVLILEGTMTAEEFDALRFLFILEGY